MLENLFRNMTDVVKNLLLINVVMFVLTLAIPEVYYMLSLHNINSELFEPYQLVTHFFMHSNEGIIHILFNMFALVMFGSQLERVWGPKRFLVFYFVSAIGALILQLVINHFQYVNFINELSQPHIDFLASEAQKVVEGGRYRIDVLEYYSYHYGTMVGASGAIMGLFAAFAYLFPNSEIMLIFLPIPIKAKYFMPIYMVIELFLGVGNFQWDNIAHFAHLGGALAGFIMVYIWQKNKTRMY